MQTITTIGLDIAMSIFQIHAVDADGDVVLRRQLKRTYAVARRSAALRSTDGSAPRTATTTARQAISHHQIPISTG